MATIRAYTTIEQSRNLAKILPLESADMYWMHGKLDNVKQHPTPNIIGNDHDEPLWNDYDIPCWSLASLLGVLPILDNRSPVISKTFNGKYRVIYHSTAYEKAILTSDYDNPIDACVAMIENLYKLNLL